jgi:hypothetical protein
MVERTYHFPSEKWEPDINLLAQEFLSFLTKVKGAQFLKLGQDRLDRVFPYYYEKMSGLKSKIYGADMDKNYIDRHKIIAIYIKSILENKPFFIATGIKRDIFRVELLANEYFCLCLMDTILMAWHNCEQKRLRLPPHERRCFIILLHQYRMYPETLNVISLSHIIYYIEKLFFIDI